MMDKHHWATRGLLIAGMAAMTVTWTGCNSSGPSPIAENSGIRLTTTEGQQLEEDMFLGKWDLDGAKTRAANSKGENIADEIFTDIFGQGWRFRTNGVMTTDRVLNDAVGSWKIKGTNTLVVKESEDRLEQTYEASFLNGYLYLTHKETGRILVFERDKFFGL